MCLRRCSWVELKADDTAHLEEACTDLDCEGRFGQISVEERYCLHWKKDFCQLVSIFGFHDIHWPTQKNIFPYTDITKAPVINYKQITLVFLINCDIVELTFPAADLQ